MSVQLVILITYAAVLLGISWWSTKLQKKASGGGMLGYLLAGRNMPTLLIIVMLAGLAIGGASTVGVAERAYTQGISAGWYNAAWGIGGILAGLFVADHFRKLNVKTVPEMMGMMFGPATRFLSVINQLLVMISITSLQYVAGGSILTVLLPDTFSFQGGMLASALVFIAITVVGGYWASGLSNVISVIVIYVGIITALVQTLQNVGGLSTLQSMLSTSGSWFDPISGIGLATVVAYVVVMTTQAFTAQGVAQIAMAARDGRTAKRGFLIGGILILPAGFLCAIFGIVAAAQFPNLANAAMALPMIVSQLSPAVGGILLAALWAADVSTAVALLMGSSTLVMEDIVKRIWTKPIKPEYELALSRVVVLLVSLFSLLLAFTVVGILRTITTALAITTSFTLLLVAGIYFPNLCKKASGFWVVLASLLLWIVWTFAPQYRVGPELIYIEWLVCGAIFWACAVFCKEPANRLVPKE